MNPLKFLKDQLLVIFCWYIQLFFILSVLFLDKNLTFEKNNIFYLLLLSTIVLVIFLLLSYFRQYKFAKEITDRLSMEQFALDLPLSKAQNEAQKKLQEYVNQLLIYHKKSLRGLQENQLEQKDFIDSWVHEIKVPLAATGLILQMIEEDISEKNYNLLEEELKKINHYVEQVLYFSRLDSFSRDYLIQENSLYKIINNVVRENSAYFIQKKIIFSLDGDDYQVLTDEKWLSFILNQIISNALKYTKPGGTVSIKLSQNNEGIWLGLQDNGIGIPKEDINRVFDKGFTGINGRTEQQHATGLGLYLAKKLSEKLGHELTIASVSGEGTTVFILFPFLTFFNEAGGKKLEI